MPKYMETFYGVKHCKSNFEDTIQQVPAMSSDAALHYCSIRV